ncbi:MAG: AMP-binding protein [Anaeromyxobacter sp.]
MHDLDRYLAARDFLLRHREDYDAARAGFRWPELSRFNWALDFFDRLAEGNRRTAVLIANPHGDVRVSYAELKDRSARLAGYLRASGVARGERILAALQNGIAIQELLLASLKIGAVMVPASTALTTEQLQERISRGHIRHLVADAAVAEQLGPEPVSGLRVVEGGSAAGWRPLDEARAAAPFVPDAPTSQDDPALLYFTSGSTAQPKLVSHSQGSYPVGHLSTLYWMGLREGDVHLNVSTPGWGKHAWSSFFAPLTAGATVVLDPHARFHPGRMLDLLERIPVTSLCAPATAWRMLLLRDPATRRVALREGLTAGEPLDPEVAARIKHAWGLTIREGYGQTETTATVGNSPGQPTVPGSMGRPLPGFDVALLDGDGAQVDEGELALSLDPYPTGLMSAYVGELALTSAALREGWYRTGDSARRGEGGYLFYGGRADEVFKSSDFRISPFELEKVLQEHPSVAEVAVVPSPDPMRGLVPKAFVRLEPDQQPNAAVAQDILRFARTHLPAYQRVRRIQFGELPRTISGKVRRGDLRRQEAGRRSTARAEGEFWQEDFGREGHE